MAEHDEWCLKRFLRVEKIGSGLASSVYRVLDSVTNTQVIASRIRGGAPKGLVILAR